MVPVSAILASMPRLVARRLGRRVVYGVPAATLIAVTVGFAVTGGRLWLVSGLGLLAATLAVTVRDVGTSRAGLNDLRRRAASSDRRLADLGSRTSQLRPEIRELQRELMETRRLLALSLIRQAGVDGAPLAARIPPALISSAVQELSDGGDVLDAHQLVTTAHGVIGLGPTTLQQLIDELRQRGYLAKALDMAQALVDTTATEGAARQFRRIQGEIAVMTGQFSPSIRSESPGFKPRPARILHVVGRSLPEHQTGYTLRTHYLALAQRDAGLDPHVVTQMGVSHDSDDFVREELDGITYHRIPGPRRGKEPFDRWLRAHVQRVANLVRVVRPAVLHAASDFVNARTALVVGREFGLPVVYESRGFWEETLLSRKAAAYGWDLDRLEARYGLPDEYLWRREREDCARRQADRVVTLDAVMADRIEAGGVPRDRISVVPNGVDVYAFPVVRRDRDLAVRLGISDDATIVGYISSLVEYEGVDTLIAAYAEVRHSSPTPLRLLIVGDGMVRDELLRCAESLGLDDVIFTGQVPHDEVLGYYSLIDIFVVPRHPAEVCHLVTPLKPFEAFATGRTVVLSNVRALAAIAQQSRAAELFEAGNPQSLAAVLLGLLKDPVRQRELASAGAAWVRTERTWAAHADTYLRLYEEIGAIASGEHRIRLLTADAIDVVELRRSIAEREPIPFEVLSSADGGDDADEVMRSGWHLAGHPAVDLALPIDWTTACMADRSWNFRLHCWDFIGPVLSAYTRTGERSYLDWCIARAASWARQFNDGDAHGTMAWYDMALGLRGHRLAYLTEQAVLRKADPGTVSLLLACVVRHQQEFFADRAFNAATNHGLYVALGECALARRLNALPGMDIVASQGEWRLAAMIRGQFAPDGGHREHSPEYHRMLLTSFVGAIEAGLITDDEARRRIGLAEDVLGWFIQPNGELVQVGDSHARQMRSARQRTSSPITEFLVSGGRRGRPDERNLLVLPETGYAVIRWPQPAGEDDHHGSSHLFLAAGFHSRTHKHADDLSITWFDRTGEILVDAGRYGYVDPLPKDSPLREQGFYYGAPQRQYVESTRAHNTVEVDGLDHNRRDRRPYGSAITEAEQRDGCFRLLAEVDHGHWHHCREIVLVPGRWLWVADRVRAQDDRSHDFRVWWNLAHEVNLASTAEGQLRADITDSDPLWIRELTGSAVIAPVAGQHEPMRGWRSKRDRELTPAWSTGFEALAVRDHEFRTLFWFGSEPPNAVPAHPFDPAPESPPARRG